MSGHRFVKLEIRDGDRLDVGLSLAVAVDLLASGQWRATTTASSIHYEATGASTRQAILNLLAARLGLTGGEA